MVIIRIVILIIACFNDFNLPGQSLTLQIITEFPAQLFPPFCGAGALQYLVLVPPPQLTPQLDHAPQTPLTGTYIYTSRDI